MKKSTFLWIITGFLILLNIFLYVTRLGGETVLSYITDAFPVVCSLISVICLYKAYRSFKELDFTKVAWLMIFSGIVFYLIAEIVFGVLELGFHYDMNKTFPSVADFFWCVGYIPLFIGLFMMFIGYKRSGFPMGNIKLIFFLALLVIIITVAVVYFVLIPVIQDPETELLTKVISLFYPIADMMVVIPAIILMYITSLFGKATISWPWRFLAFGFICFSVADILYSYLSWQDLYGSGNLIDLLWHMGYLFIGLAGLYQKELIESFKEGK